MLRKFFILATSAGFLGLFYLLIAKRNYAIAVIALLVSAGLILLERIKITGPTQSGWLEKYERILYPAAIVLTVFGIYYPVISSYFVGDDFVFVRLFHAKPLKEFAKLFVHEWSEGSWGMPSQDLRPVVALSFKWDGYVWGTNPRPYHVTNLALHALNSLLVYLIAVAFAGGKRWVGFVAGLLFAALPAHAEAVCWISGRIELLATFFYASAFLLFVLFRRDGRLRYYWLSVIAFTLALFSKESVIPFPCAIGLYDLLRHRGPPARWVRSLAAQIKTYIPFLIVLFVYLGIRRSLFGNFARENVLVEHTVDRLQQFLVSQDFYLRWLLFPIYEIIYKFPITLQENFSVIVLTGALLGLLLAWSLRLWRSGSESEQTILHLIYFGLVWYGLTIIPYLVVKYALAKHLYLASVGTCVAIGFLLFPASAAGASKTGWGRVVAAIFLVLFYAGMLRQRIDDAWVTAGNISRHAKTDIETLAETVPKGSTVFLVGMPPSYQEAVSLAWSLPFALQPPFRARDLYADYQVIEDPNIYCCSLWFWWQARKPIILSLLDDRSTTALYMMYWDPDTLSVKSKKKEIRGEVLRAQLDEIFQRPVENMDEITDEEAGRLVAILQD